MRFYGFIACFVLVVSAFIGCTSDGGSEPLAGIEIGNPALALTANFSVDYAEVEPGSLRKQDKDEEPVLLDTFSMDLAEVRSFSSYYVAVSVDPTEGLAIWPDEDAPEEVETETEEFGEEDSKNDEPAGNEGVKGTVVDAKV